MSSFGCEGASVPLGISLVCNLPFSLRRDPPCCAREGIPSWFSKRPKKPSSLHSTADRPMRGSWEDEGSRDPRVQIPRTLEPQWGPTEREKSHKDRTWAKVYGGGRNPRRSSRAGDVSTRSNKCGVFLPTKRTWWHRSASLCLCSPSVKRDKNPNFRDGRGLSFGTTEGHFAPDVKNG